MEFLAGFIGATMLLYGIVRVCQWIDNKWG